MATIAAQHDSARPTKSYARKRPQTRRFGQLHPGPHFHEDFVTVTRPAPRAADNAQFALYYRVYHPSQLHSAETPPLLVVHGGPSLPSDYLHPLARQFSPSRAIVFYDQLGCGRSSQPEELCMYSIENAVQDLQDLVRSLQLEKFHLLGHSFGGILAYEYVAAGQGSGDCLSLTLHSTPSNMRISLEECARLEEEVKDELQFENTEAEEAMRAIQQELRRRCECRLDRLPEPLVSALEGRGTRFGPAEVADYVARPPPRGAALPPVLVVRGQYDFVTAKCVGGWREIFVPDATARGPAYREEVLRDAAHYGHLEDACAFGDLIGGHCFVHDY